MRHSFNMNVFVEDTVFLVIRIIVSSGLGSNRPKWTSLTSITWLELWKRLCYKMHQIVLIKNHN